MSLVHAGVERNTRNAAVEVGNVHFSECLSGVAMKKDTIRASDISDLFDGMENSDFIIGRHDGNRSNQPS